MKTREQIIESMCYTFRHDFGLQKHEMSKIGITAGMTEDEREYLRGKMMSIFDNDIAPHMEFKK